MIFFKKTPFNLKLSRPQDFYMFWRKSLSPIYMLVWVQTYGGIEETLVTDAILARPPRALLQTLAAKFREEIKVFLGKHHLPSFLPQFCRPPISTEDVALVVPLLLCCGADAVVPTPRPWEAPFATVVMPMLPCVEASVVLWPPLPSVSLISNSDCSKALNILCLSCS